LRHSTLQDRSPVNANTWTTSDHRQRTSNPEVIHSLFWRPPANRQSDLSTGETLAVVTDAAFTRQAQIDSN
jgi:hypothetical protein